MIKSMLGGIWNNLIDFVTGIFALIPQFLYFIYTCCASLLDAIQFVMRKLAGLDVYYVNGTEVKGDIVYDIISGILGINGGTSARYSSLATVFWSLIIFGVITLILTTIFAIIKSHYASDVNKTNPFAIIRSSIKSIFTIAIIPVVSIFGIYLANILLKTLDEITSPQSTAQIEEVYKNSSVNYATFFQQGTTHTDEKAYASYDFFSFGSYTNSATFSGAMFRVCASSANRVRSGSYTASKSTTKDGSAKKYIAGKWSDLGIFTSKAESEDIRREEVAEMIDTAFAYNLTMQDRATASLLGSESWSLVSSYAYLESAVWYAGTINFKSFSKYNVGLVWYYYNLWGFNFFVGFAGMAIAITFFSSVVFGLIVRMIEVLALFLVFPPLAGIGPLDGNKAIGEWKKKFMSDILMGYGAVVGLNLVFLLLNEVQKITFFSSVLLNHLTSIILILAALSVLKDIVKLVSGFVGGGDAVAVGAATKGEVAKIATDAAVKTAKVAKKVIKVMAVAVPAAKAMNAAIKKIDEAKKKIQSKMNKSGMNNIQANLAKSTKDKKNAGEKAKEEESLSDLSTEEFEKTLESFDDDKVDTDAELNNLTSKYETGKGSGKKAKDLYSKFLNDYNQGVANIDADASLSDDQKDEKKSELRSSLIESTVAEYGEGNTHAVNARGFRIAEAKAAEEMLEIQGEIDDIKSGKRTFDGAGNVVNKPRSNFKNAVLDMGGKTIKLIGTITGGSKAKKALEEAGLIDESKEIIQSIYQNAGLNDKTNYFESGNSILSTRKQKENIEKNKSAYYDLQQRLMKNASIMEKEAIEKLVSAISSYSSTKKTITTTVKASPIILKGIAGVFDQARVTDNPEAVRKLKPIIKLRLQNEARKDKKDKKPTLPSWIDDQYIEQLAKEVVFKMAGKTKNQIEMLINGSDRSDPYAEEFNDKIEKAMKGES